MLSNLALWALSDLLRSHVTPVCSGGAGPASFQSGIGVISGWVCEADTVEIELNGVPHEAAYGTERVDTQGACGDTDNGFGLLFNWNLLGDGEYVVIATVDRGVGAHDGAGDDPGGGVRAGRRWRVCGGGLPPSGRGGDAHLAGVQPELCDY